MGQRANLAIGNASSYELFYSHWCANTLPRDLFWGPGHALDFISQQRAVDQSDGWLDTIWAEGGAVLDQEKRLFLLYGGCDLLYDVPLRRVYLELLAEAWVDWEIRWAFEGIVEIAEYLGVDRKNLIAVSDDSTDHSTDNATLLSPPQERDWLQCIGSIKSDSKLRIYPLGGMPIDYLLAGPQIVAASKDIGSLASLNASDWTEAFPSGGFHVDLEERRLDFWLASDCPNAPQEVASIWAGWEVNWHKDCFESHLALTQSALVMESPPKSQLLSNVIKILDRESKPVDVLDLAKTLSQDGKKVEVNPFAIRDDRISIGSEQRKSILAQCVNAINGR